MGLLEKLWLISLPLGRDGLRAWFFQVSLQSDFWWIFCELGYSSDGTSGGAEMFSLSW